MVAHSEIIAILAAVDSFNSLSFGRSRFPQTIFVRLQSQTFR
ncbi:hypothetical protein [Oculatella sp. FACHB-28]|nr:hypothetical protein [Oculatella sp. FACHB-28]